MANRFDICEAYWCFMVDWNKDGLTRRCRAKGRGIGVQLDRMKFRPSMALGTDNLEDDAREVYDALVEKYYPEYLKNRAEAEERLGRYIDTGPLAKDDHDSPDY